MRIKKLIKETKGSAVVEAILMSPIFVYMFMFTVIQVLSFAFNGFAYESSKTFMNAFESSRTIEIALDNLALKAAKDRIDITKITIVLPNNSEISLTFPEDNNANLTSFKDYIINVKEEIVDLTDKDGNVIMEDKLDAMGKPVKDEKGEIVQIPVKTKKVVEADFNIALLAQSSPEIYSQFKNNWTKGYTIKIETKLNVLGKLGGWATYTLKLGKNNPIEMKIFPNDTITITTTGIIESELGGV